MRHLGEADRKRSTPVASRLALQRQKLRLPLLPTTTIGSFPQTPALRDLRARRRAGDLTAGDYESAIRRLIEEAIGLQERLGLDVLVHGEPERNDMVEFFGEKLQGAAVTQHGWVQSYGSRCVKPPILFGDVSRPEAITVRLAAHAQSLTSRPVKGMLTGPITIMKWSFVRDDESLEHTCTALALALRDEVLDLERAGIGVIQVDEPAFREALPLSRSRRADYLRWAVGCFRLATSAVRAETQIHTHMCYSEFGEILDAIAELDADVVSIESARSGMDMVDSFTSTRAFPSELGLGIYDIHSPRIPDEAEMLAMLERALAALGPHKVWVNPDCGLKTRTWDEVELALKRMVRVAERARTRWAMNPPSGPTPPAA
jgi:5-methyltetrahydropteroyltriglutamate--homocysteine methyltransferase